MIAPYPTTSRARSVTTMAISIPRAASWLPRRALAGLVRPFRPRMNRTAATRYRKPETVGFTAGAPT